jgi:hypothetical protein
MTRAPAKAAVPARRAPALDLRSVNLLHELILSMARVGGGGQPTLRGLRARLDELALDYPAIHAQLLRAALPLRAEVSHGLQVQIVHFTAPVAADWRAREAAQGLRPAPGGAGLSRPRSATDDVAITRYRQ